MYSRIPLSELHVSNRFQFLSIVNLINNSFCISPLSRIPTISNYFSLPLRVRDSGVLLYQAG